MRFGNQPPGSPSPKSRLVSKHCQGARKTELTYLSPPRDHHPVSSSCNHNSVGKRPTWDEHCNARHYPKVHEQRYGHAQNPGFRDWDKHDSSAQIDHLLGWGTILVGSLHLMTEQSNPKTHHATIQPAYLNNPISKSHSAILCQWLLHRTTATRVYNRM